MYSFDEIDEEMAGLEARRRKAAKPQQGAKGIRL